LLLSGAVIQQRRASSISLGDGNNIALKRKIRAQANLVEYSPMFVLLIAGAELMAGASISLWLLALVFLASRILHGVGMAFTRNSPKLRH